MKYLNGKLGKKGKTNKAWIEKKNSLKRKQVKLPCIKIDKSL